MLEWLIYMIQYRPAQESGGTIQARSKVFKGVVCSQTPVAISRGIWWHSEEDFDICYPSTP